ncbi:hypothetical protein GCM10022215_19260 [Nocardioides fonticola]|uniref:Uncharacterized protein n=1 Tax=Nocardioides fonticola TaxID=450363 RepID=A0ABP7XKM1_9ACTN
MTPPAPTDAPRLSSAVAWEFVIISEGARHGDPMLLGGHLMQRARAISVLDAELVQPRRLAVALLAWVMAIGAAALLTVVAWEGVALPVRIVALVGGSGLLAIAAVLARRVRYIGRRVVEAYCWWSVLPRLIAGAEGTAESWGGSAVRNAVEARAWYVHPRRYLSAALAAAGLLAPLILVRLATAERTTSEVLWPPVQGQALAVAFVGVALPSWYAAGALFRDMSRAGSAQAQKDPVTRRFLHRR